MSYNQDKYPWMGHRRKGQRTWQESWAQLPREEAFNQDLKQWSKRSDSDAEKTGMKTLESSLWQ